MSELRAFQQRFGGAILRARLRPDEAADSAFALALRIHRNSATKAMVDALQANYPTVRELVGEEWFRAAALECALAHPPRDPVLALFGAAFSDFLADFAPAAELPYLPDVARIDRLWTEAHLAPDSIPLDAEALAGLAPQALGARRVALHPAARLARVRYSAATIWMQHRLPPGGRVPLHIDDIGEGILLTRPAGVVRYQLLSTAELLFLERVQSGATLGDAAVAALESAPTTDIGQLLARVLTAGTFAIDLEQTP